MTAATEGVEPGAPVPADAVDPELIRLPVPTPRRHPGVAIAVLLVGALLIYRLRADIHYALTPGEPQDLGSAVAALKSGKLAAAVDGYVAVSGIPDHRNGLAYDPKGGRARVQLFRLLGTGSRLLVTTPASSGPPFVDRFVGRLRHLDDLSFDDTIRAAWGQTQVLRALDLTKLRALPPGALPSPYETTDRAGEGLRVTGQQDLLIDVLFEDDVRVLLSKDKFPSEADARHEVERLGLSHGPGVETKDGFGYVLRLPPKGAGTGGGDRQRALAQIDAQGMWLWHRVETYRVPAAAVQVTPAGLSLPGPDSLAQPVRYMEQAPPPAPTDAGATAAAPQPQPAPPKPEAQRQLVAQKDPNTLILWEQIQAVQVSEPLAVPADALVLIDGETPKSFGWTLPLAALLAAFMAFNIWYLARSLKKDKEAAA